MMSVSNSNCRSKSDVAYIEENHNEVLAHILKSVGCKRIPLTDNLLVHFDSHPDLLLPPNLTHGDLMDPEMDKYELAYEKLSIENWILPAAYMGIVKTILWIHPPWSAQIPSGTYRFLIGSQRDPPHKIRVTCCESYFLSEGIVEREELLTQTKEITLIVLPLSNQNPEEDLISSFLHRHHSGYILDFDLDFYSVRNPFLNLYSSVNLYSRLKKIYLFDPVPENLKGVSKLDYALESGRKRRILLDKLEDVFSYLNENQSLVGYDGIGNEFIGEIEAIKDDIERVYEGEENIDWMTIHDAGCTCDDSELPQHESSDDEIGDLMTQTKKFLQNVTPTKPDLVTIARSTVDDFTPSHQVENIQSRLIKLLQDFIPEIIVHKEYDSM